MTCSSFCCLFMSSISRSLLFLWASCSSFCALRICSRFLFSRTFWSSGLFWGARPLRTNGTATRYQKCKLIKPRRVPADANPAAATPFWFDLVSVLEHLDYNSCFQMSFDLEPHKYSTVACPWKVPADFGEKGLKPLQPRSSPLRYSLHGSRVGIMLFWNQKECYATCVYVANKTKQKKQRHLTKVSCDDRKKRNYIIVKSPSKLWGEGGGRGKRLGCRGYLRQKNRDGLGAVLYTLKTCTQHRMTINPEAHKGSGGTKCAADQSS